MKGMRALLDVAIGFAVAAVVVGQSAAFVMPSSQCWGIRTPAKILQLRPQVSMLAGTASAISSNENLLPGIEAIDSMNEELCSKLEELREKPYFRLYSVDMLASCEYMPQELFECYSETCEVYPVDDEMVPVAIKKADADEHEFELDGWARWDMPSEDYYDTEEFPEDYTGYDGAEVWNFIHDKICFDGYGYNDDHWKADFNKAVSGLHSMVAAQVIRGIKEKADSGEPFSESEIWTDPSVEFKRRLSPDGEVPLALENLYFSFMLLLAAASRAKDRLLADCGSGKIDGMAAAELADILSFPLLKDSSVELASQKLHENTIRDPDSKAALWEARLRTRDLFRIINCVQCNKCRLHGKISVMGLSTAFQILVGRSGEGGDVNPLHRVELAALMSTLYKFSRAIEICKSMK